MEGAFQSLYRATRKSDCMLRAASDGTEGYGEQKKYDFEHDVSMAPAVRGRRALGPPAGRRR